MANMLNKEILELLTPYLTERLGQIFSENEEHQKAVKEENRLFEQFYDKLDKEQAELLEQYFAAANATAAIKERLTYQQGMKDMLALLKALT